MEQLLKIKERLCNNYTMVCPSVRGDTPRALASGLSPVQADNPWYYYLIHLYHPQKCRLVQKEIFRAKVCDIWQEWYKSQKTSGSITVKNLCIGTDRSQHTVQTKIRLLLKKQSDQGLRCLPLHQLLLDALMQCYIKLYQF